MIDEKLFNERIIDKDSGVPLYYQLYSFLKKMIQEEKIKEGEQLPTEEELCALLGISRPTVRQAYNRLASDSLVARQRSKGSVVQKARVMKNFLNKVTTFYDEVNSKSDNVTTKVVKLELIDDFDEAKEILKCEKLIHLARVRSVNGKPVVYLDSYLSYAYFRELLTVDFEKSSLYGSMKEVGREVIKAQRTITAIKANKRIAEYLKMPIGDPLIYTITEGIGNDGEIIEYSLAQYNAEVAKFEILVNN